MTIRVWVDGERVDDKPAISALDHGVTVGDGVFETCKVQDGRVFARTRHHDRLDRSLAGLGLPAADRAFLDEGIKAVLAESTGLARLRYTVTGGVGPLGSERGTSGLTYVVMATEIERPAPTTRVVTVPWPRNERSAVAGLKTTSYAENVVALARAREAGATEALMPNTRGELCEGTGSNVFVVYGGQVLTPPLDSGALAGVTRSLVIQWGRAAGLSVVETMLPMSLLKTCDEVFITSSTRDVQPVSAVDDRELGAPGPITSQIAEVFERAAAADEDPAP
ncbi:aminodeoxychorismate lyase [Luteipulveratus sp. YIM 133132]|uniref:aminotransferase class IV n=1 Tax=Luteipulveratus flavus TaxID=3031728 RepID=UPI0023AFA253|nr:aminodeoxychorismate lyase [Luteipulveratus sp. YIM 133132]MDE9364451.1 aminodeoxychorismate lyase [Luteipulveratus sp. YIM 133132]